ncbi:MAG: TIGR04551 family protein [Polyangiaceae bacterium]
MARAQDSGTPPAPSSTGAPNGQAPTITPARSSLVPATASPSPSPAPATPAINPAHDQMDLAAQGALHPSGGEMVAAPQEVFSEDWWGKARPVIELHGYFRTRAQLFQNLALGRHGSSLQGTDPQNLAPIPLDQAYTQLTGTQTGPAICGAGTQPNGIPNGNCNDKTESGANVRLRLDPEIDISDNLRIQTEIFALDNLVLGSTPNAYAMQPAAAGTTMGANSKGYVSAGFNRFAPLSFLSSTQGPPTAGVNGTTNSINVQRVWAEYNTPLGQLRFGRMPGNWGLGMVENSGDGIDSDYQTTLDRIMFVTGLKSMDLYLGGAWDFVSTGPTNGTAYDVYGGQPYNTCNLCNVNEWAAFVSHRTNPEIQRLKLARGDLVINGGVYTTYRSQYLDVATGQTPYTDDNSTNALDNGLEPRRAWAVTPDLWVQMLWRKFRFEAEAATINGQIGSYPTLGQNLFNPTGIREYGLVTQTELRAVEDKLDLQFGFGWSSGDPYANNPQTGATAGGVGTGALSPPSGGGLQGEFPNTNNQVADISTFRFHPDYHVDLIFFRNILQQIEGAYYFRPSIDYDFLRHADGEKLGGGAAVIWSRASQFIQTPGHARDLGVELDAQLYYQSKDGSLNDDTTKIGGFFAMLQYGVFFPLAGLNYLPGETSNLPSAGLSTAQTIRLFLGVAY